MKKNGFTLVELVGVIVILALLMLFVFPRLINVIKKSSDESDEITKTLIYNVAETYIKERKNTYKQKNGNSYCITLKELVDSTDLSSPLKLSESNVDITNTKSVQVKYNDGFSYELVDNDQCKEIRASICSLESDTGDSGISVGDKYTCKVDPNKEAYTFYVLSTNEDGTTNLIMDQNINSDGTPAGLTGVTASTNTEQFNLIAWNDESDQSINSYGPVTAIQFLYNATKNWTNINPLNYAYYDKQLQGGSFGYTSFISIDGVAVITSATDPTIATTIGTSGEPLRTRLPIYSSDSTNSEVSDKTATNAYLYDNLDSSDSSAPYGYWTLSSRTTLSNNAWIVRCSEIVGSDDVFDLFYGVRPVITLDM